VAAYIGSRHRFGGREFRFGIVELEQLHGGGIVGIRFPRPVRDALLAFLPSRWRWKRHHTILNYCYCNHPHLEVDVPRRLPLSSVIEFLRSDFGVHS
jgi:hypothetical protein